MNSPNNATNEKILKKLIKNAIKKVENGSGSTWEIKDTFKTLEGNCFKLCKSGHREVLNDIKELAHKILDSIARRE